MYAKKFMYDTWQQHPGDSLNGDDTITYPCNWNQVDN